MVGVDVGGTVRQLSFAGSCDDHRDERAGLPREIAILASGLGAPVEQAVIGQRR